MTDQNPATHSPSSPKLEAAEREVALAHARFNEDLKRASKAGKRLTTDIVSNAKPALIGVAVVTGVALIVAVWRARKSPKTIRIAAAPAPRSVWFELGRAVALTLASSAGKHLAARLAAGMMQEQRAPLGQSGAPYPRPPADS